MDRSNNFGSKKEDLVLPDAFPPPDAASIAQIQAVCQWAKEHFTEILMHKKQGHFLSIIHNLQLFHPVFIIFPEERKDLTIYGQVFSKLRTAQKFGPFKMVLSSYFSGILRRFYKEKSDIFSRFPAARQRSRKMQKIPS